MKINLFTTICYWAKVGLLVFLVSSCGEDYLNTNPTASTSPSVVFETTEKAATAVNGLARMMVTQYMETIGYNGEGTIKLWYGDYPGETMGVNLSGWSNVINQTYHNSISGAYCRYPWYYYYKIISNANLILSYIDDAEGSEEYRGYLKAQTLTFRAYCYFMLSQLYCYRWIDSNDGETDGMILREDTDWGEMPRSTLKETYKFVYDDLDEAIRLFLAAPAIGRNKTTENYLPDLSVAYAVYARAAITKQDYGLAAEYAAKARQGYSLMSVSDYKSGFNSVNDEWIWSSYGGSDQDLFYYGYFAMVGYNANSSHMRSYPKYISRILYNQIPETDIRRDLFLDPLDYTYTTSTGAAGSSSTLRPYAYSLYPILESNGSNVFAYMQFKISSAEQVGIGHLNHFRASEMYFIEAEAQYFLGNEGATRNLLNELTRDSGRDPAYVCDKTGEDLFEEIKLYRAIELWGEGFNWFDLKRWNDPVVRKTYANGGNAITSHAVTIEPEAENRWTWMVPIAETDYNPAVTN